MDSEPPRFVWRRLEIMMVFPMPTVGNNKYRDFNRAGLTFYNTKQLWQESDVPSTQITSKGTNHHYNSNTVSNGCLLAP